MAHLTPLYDLSHLESCLTGGDSFMILAANRRLAAKISQAFQYKAAHQSKAFVPPAIFAISDFLHSEYQRAVLNGHLPPNEIISNTLERHLWRKAIHEHFDDDTSLINISSTIPLLKSAHQLRVQYGLDKHCLNPKIEHWIASFERSCQSLGLITSYAAEALVIELFRDTAPDKQVYFIGFEDFSPLYQSFYSYLAGSKISPNSDGNKEQLLWFDNREQELAAAIDKAIEYTCAFPQHRFGIIDPQLGQHKGLVERLVSERFSTSAFSVFADRQVEPINISAGRPIGEMPMIRAALSLVQTWRDRIETTMLHSLCHTPFIAGADTEAIVRSDLYQQILNQGRPDNSQAYLRERAAETCPMLASCWSTAADQARRLSLSHQTLTVAQWCDQLDHLLSIWAWPGQRETDSVEYQQLVLWRDLMADLRRFPSEITLDLSSFQALLTDHCGNNMFQPEVEDSPIQILGSLEAASLRFDCVWLVGLSDKEFPAAASPHPYIDLHIQRLHRMPHCDAARELQYSRALLSSYRAGCPNITYSYARFEGDIENRPSPLINHLHPHQGSVKPRPEIQIEIDRFEDEWAPPVEDPNSIKGGASILADQAACPFRAFATHRLNLKRVDPVSRAMPAHITGTAIHHALEILMPKGLESKDLVIHAGHTLEQAADAAVAVLRQKRPDIMHSRLQALEKQRITSLLNAWLAVEQQRPPFVIEATEKPCETSLAGLPLRLRVDRIDRLQANRLMIIDYKTGSVSTSQWRDDRPDDPQLLLYALLGDNGDIDAIAKASLKSGEMCFSGMSSIETNIKGIKPMIDVDGADTQQFWSDQKIRWHRRLEDLAGEFLGGDAQVLPQTDSSCKYCHLKDVCRIGERR